MIQLDFGGRLLLLLKVYDVNIIKIGNYDEAIRDLENLRGSAEFELAVIDALVYTHKQRPRVDDAAVDDLEDSRRGVEV